MNLFESHKVRRSVMTVGLAAGCVALVGCSHNTAGEGNDFIIRGPVTDVTDDSVQIMPEQLIEAHGKARGWFKPDHKSRSHDNYMGGTWCTQQNVGIVFDKNGTQGELDEIITEGEYVEIRGKLRESHDSCGKYDDWNWRPVFDQVYELSR